MSIPVFKSYPQYVTAHDHTIVTIFCVFIRVNNRSILRAKLSKLFHEIKKAPKFSSFTTVFTTSANNIDVHGWSALIFNDWTIKLFVEVTEQPYDISAFNFQFLSIIFLTFTHPKESHSSQLYAAKSTKNTWQRDLIRKERVNDP